MKYIATVNGKTYTIEINREDRILCEGVERAVDFRLIDQQHVYSLLLDNASYEALIQERKGNTGSSCGATSSPCRWRMSGSAACGKPRAGARPRRRGNGESPHARPHRRRAGPGRTARPQREKLVLLESMKMQKRDPGPRDGVVKAVRVRPGQSVEQNQILVVLG
jgi:hypothetical protein